MENILFSRGHIRATKMHFAIVPGGFVRLKDGPLPNGSIVVDGKWHEGKPRISVHRVVNSCLVKVGRDCPAAVKCAIYEVVKGKLLEMPAKMYAFAAEVAWRTIVARKSQE
jgi:hypothetical protein